MEFQTQAQTLVRDILAYVLDGRVDEEARITFAGWITDAIEAAVEAKAIELSHAVGLAGPANAVEMHEPHRGPARHARPVVSPGGRSAAHCQRGVCRRRTTRSTGGVGAGRGALPLGARTVSRRSRGLAGAARLAERHRGGDRGPERGRRSLSPGDRRAGGAAQWI